MQENLEKIIKKRDKNSNIPYYWKKFQSNDKNTHSKLDTIEEFFQQLPHQMFDIENQLWKSEKLFDLERTYIDLKIIIS